MDKKQEEKLIQDLRDANRAASSAASQTDDGGTCNMDFVLIPVGKNCPLGSRLSKKLDSLFKRFGGYRYSGRWYGRGYGLSYAHGQANKRASATVAARNALKDWDAGVIHIMD